MTSHLRQRTRLLKQYRTGTQKPEAAQLHGLNIGSVCNFTKHIRGHPKQGVHVIRQHGIKLLNRLMTDGYLVSDFVVSTVRNLQRRFPIIMSARYRDKTFFYLKGREEEAIEGYFREKPDRIINYRAIEEMAYLLGVKVSNKDQRKLLERNKRKHDAYWRSRRLIQRRMEEFDPDCIFPHKKEQAEPGFRLFPKVEYMK